MEAWLAWQSWQRPGVLIECETCGEMVSVHEYEWFEDTCKTCHAEHVAEWLRVVMGRAY